MLNLQYHTSLGTKRTHAHTHVESVCLFVRECLPTLIYVTLQWCIWSISQHDPVWSSQAFWKDRYIYLLIPTPSCFLKHHSSKRAFLLLSHFLQALCAMTYLHTWLTTEHYAALQGPPVPCCLHDKAHSSFRDAPQLIYMDAAFSLRFPAGLLRANRSQCNWGQGEPQWPPAAGFYPHRSHTKQHITWVWAVVSGHRLGFSWESN